MSFYDKIDELHHMIQGIPVSEIIEMRIKIEESRGRYKYCKCPFHGGNIGSFVITDSLGIFKCFACDEVSGNGIKFIKLYDGISYLEAMDKIGIHFGLIKEPISGRKNREEKENYLRSILKRDTKEQIEQRADISVLDDYFRKFMKFTTLEEEDREYLIGRGLTEEEIREDEYFTMPNLWKVRDFIESIPNAEMLASIPGFYKEEGKWRIFKKKGIGIPIKNHNGQISGIQIRSSNAESKTRYLWFSAASMGGVSSGSPVDVIYPEQSKSESSVFITEGKFKSRAIVKKTKNISISVQGVSSWRNAVSEIQSMETIKNTAIVFDADLMTKKEVLMQVYKFASKLFSLGKNVSVFCWKEEYGKGIDDLIESGNIDKIKKLKISNDETKSEKSFIEKITNLINEK